MANSLTANVVDIGRDRILFDYFVNYVFPQYALPWNNFYTNIDAVPYNIRNTERNAAARIEKTPLNVNSNPEIFLLPGNFLPDWKATTIIPSQGSILDLSATKSVLGQFISQECTGNQFQYVYSGKFIGVNPRDPCKDIPEEFFRNNKWIVLHFNLANKLTSNKQSVVVVTQDKVDPCDCCATPKLFSTLSGSITIDDKETIFIKNPIPYASADDKVEKLVELDKHNTLYGLFGNRIFIAIKTDKFKEKNASVSYNISVRICESPSFAVGIGSSLGL